MVSFRIRYKKLGGHIHARVYSSEFGLETTHGMNGTLVFREPEWEAFKDAMAMGASESVEPNAVSVVFIDDLNLSEE